MISSVDFYGFATFANIWILGNGGICHRLVYNLYHQFVQGTEKFSTPLYISKHFIYYLMIILTKPLVKKKAKKFYFLKWRFFKMHLSHQIALTTHAFSGKIFYFLKEHFFFLIPIFLTYKKRAGLIFTGFTQNELLFKFKLTLTSS